MLHLPLSGKLGLEMKIKAKEPFLIIWITFTLFLSAEGTASLINDFLSSGEVAGETEGLLAQYDPELGWVMRPNLRMADFYGRGADVHTNSSGLRSDQDYGSNPERGRRRLICSGDSFTFGMGVGNQDTWCQMLSGPKLETVNLGQPGFSLDQIYLFARREVGALKPDFHVVAFTVNDFRPLLMPAFLHYYGKPFLQNDQGELVLEKKPISRTWLSPHFLLKFEEGVRRLNIVTLMRRFGYFTSDYYGGLKVEDSFPLAIRIFEKMNEFDRALGSRIAFVLLPSQSEDPQLQEISSLPEI